MSKFQATPGELALVKRIFAHAQDVLGLASRDVLPGQFAIEIFKDCGLSPGTLGDIWDIADTDNRGFLSPNELAAALRLIGWVQSGEKVDKVHVDQCGPLPTLKLVDIEMDRTEKGSSFPPFSHSDGRMCKRIFEEARPLNGLIGGEPARDIFVKSGLPAIDLWNIWNLADTKARGALDIVDFALGMYLIQVRCAKKALQLPSTVPPSLYEEITNTLRPISGSSPGPTVSGSLPNPNSKSTIIAQPASPSTLGLEAFSNSQSDQTPNQAHPTTDGTPQHPALADQYFLLLDTAKTGIIKAEVAASFMMGSALPPDALATIWDAVTFNDSKYLSKSEFAALFHATQRRLAGTDVPASASPTSPRYKSASKTPLSPPPSPKVAISPRARRVTVALDPPPKDTKPSTSKISISPQNSMPSLNTNLKLSGALKSLWENSSQSAHHTPGGSDASPILPMRTRERQTPSSLPRGDLRRASTPTLATAAMSDPFSDHSASTIAVDGSSSGEGQDAPGPPPNPRQLKPPRRALRLSEFHPAEDEGIFYELSRRNELLETTITQLMSQLKSHTDSSQLLLRRDRETFSQEQESLIRENEAMKRQMIDMEQSMSQLLTATTEHTEGLVKKIDNLSNQVVELERCKDNLERASASALELSQEHDGLRQQIEEMKTKDHLSERRIRTLNTETERLKEEVEHLRSRALEMQDLISRPSRSGDNPREMQLLMNDLTKENQNLKQRLRDMEQSTTELLLSNTNQTQDENLVRENRRLTQLLRRAERTITASTGQHAEVLTRAEALERENLDFKQRLRELQESSTGRRILTRRGDVQRRVEHLTQENRRLTHQLQQISTPTPSVELDSEVAPPAYDDIPRS